MLRPDTDIEAIHRRQEGTLPGLFGLRVTELVQGRVGAAMPLAPWMLAPNGFLHAASVILLADTCAGFATMAHLPDGAKGFTTIELKTNFLGTAREGLVTCRAEAEHLGRTTQVWSVVVLGPAEQGGRRLALFRCTQMVLW